MSVTAAGHFGEVLHGRIGPAGPGALITLPCPLLTAEARFSGAEERHGLLPRSRVRALPDGIGLPVPGPVRLTGALGHVIAHTGSARGLLFAPGTIPSLARALLASHGFRRVISFQAGGECRI